MENKFIRTVSPLSLAVMLFIDAASLLFFILSIRAVIKNFKTVTVVFFLIVLIITATVVLATLELLKSGVIFKQRSVEFTAADSDNKYKYSEIEKAEVVKDTGVSLKKNFVSRYSSVILHLKNGDTATVELGLTTVKKLSEIEEELNKRI